MKQNHITHLKLNPDLEARIIEEIEEGMNEINSDYDEIGWEKKIQADKDFYDGIMDPNKWGPWPGSAKYFMKLGATHIDIIASIAMRQQVGIHPIIQMESADDEDGHPELRDREDKQDKRLRNKIKIEKLLKSGVNREAGKHGVAIVKVCYTSGEKTLTSSVTYGSNEVDGYMADASKYGHDKDVVTGNVDILRRGENVEVNVDNTIPGYSGPKAYRVAIEDWFARPGIRDLDKQRLVAERLRYTWRNIQELIDEGYFLKNSADKIKEKYQGKEWERDYELFECILYAKLFKKWQKFVITYDPDTQTVMRAIFFPYKHGKCYYVPYYVKERDDSLIGYSLRNMVGQNNDYINDVMNGMLDRSSLDNNPAKRISLAAQKANAAVIWGPDALYVSNEEIQILGTQNRTIDDMSLLGILNGLLQTTDGVNAEVLSGQVATSDPTAPAAKHAMQTQSTSFRIEDYVISLQQSTEELSYLVEEIEKQFNPEVMKTPGMELNVRHIAHGTSLNINKVQQIAILKDYLQVMGMVAPDVVQDREWRRKWITMYVNNIGGVVEMNKKELIPEDIGALPPPAGSGQDVERSIKDIVGQMTDEEVEALEQLEPEELAELGL